MDGDTYDVTEVAATPGLDLKVDFVSVTKFTHVQVVAYYTGSTASHAISIQLYDWQRSAWDTFNSMQGDGVVMHDYSFFVPCPANYIGTGSDAGDVRVRLNHTMLGDVTHDVYVDVVALYDRDWKVDHHWGPWR